MLVEEYDGKLPDTMEELLKFPGVGRKVANLLLGDLWNKGGIVADTHCIRICGRLGMYPESMKDPVKTEKIMNAQKARGANFTSGSLIQRAKALIPILIPLFVSAINRALELANAMECRCYRGGGGRTRMTILRFAAKDFIAAGVVCLLFVGILLLNFYFPALIT